MTEIQIARWIIVMILIVIIILIWKINKAASPDMSGLASGFLILYGLLPPIVGFSYLFIKFTFGNVTGSPLIILLWSSIGIIPSGIILFFIVCSIGVLRGKLKRK